MLQNRGLTSEVSQRKDGGLASLPTEAGKFKLPPPMVTLVEKRSSDKFCDFHNDKRHSYDECMQLKKQIEELRLLVTIETPDTFYKSMDDFMIVRSLTPVQWYHGRPEIRRKSSMPSTPTEIPKRGWSPVNEILKKLGYIAALAAADMSGVPTNQIAEHDSIILEDIPPVRQKKRGQALERAKAIQTEVQKLVEAGIMREVYYHEWYPT
ncbi:hypothetical protein Tco_1219943 [Tanacetum coccineum]